MGSGALVGLEALAGGLNQLRAGNERRRVEAQENRAEGREDERLALEKQRAKLQIKQFGLAIENAEFQLALSRARGTPDEQIAQEEQLAAIKLQKLQQDLELDKMVALADIDLSKIRGEAALLNARGKPDQGPAIADLLEERSKNFRDRADGLRDQIEDAIGAGVKEEEILPLREELVALSNEQTVHEQQRDAFLRQGLGIPEQQVSEPQEPPPPEPPAPGPSALASSFGITKDVILGDEPNIEDLLNVGRTAASIKQGLGAAAERGSEIFRQSPLTAPFRNILTEKERSPDTPEIKPPLSNLLNLLFGQR